MQKMPRLVKWVVSGVIVLGLLGGLLVFVVYLGAQHQAHIPPCEAMRPYLLYHGTYYFEQFGVDLPSSSRGNLVTTIGDGPSQAGSCLGAGTAVYSVKGRSITTDLALDAGDGLRLFEVPSVTPTPTASTPGLAWMPLYR